MESMISRIFDYLHRVLQYLCRRPRYGEYHVSDIVKKALIITPRYVWLKECVHISYNSRIEGVAEYAGKTYNPQIILEKGVSIQQNLHLTCAERIVIGPDTAIGANVTVTDIHHPYTDITKPIDAQPIEVHPVEIGAECKIYNNAVILPGTKIGRHVTVGANSVVSGVIPDYCVVVGAPARIVKQYDAATGQWLKKDDNVG